MQGISVARSAGRDLYIGQSSTPITSRSRMSHERDREKQASELPKLTTIIVKAGEESPENVMKASRGRDNQR